MNNSLFDRINKLGPFGTIDVELKKGSSELFELIEEFDIDSLSIGEIDEYQTDSAKIQVTRIDIDTFYVCITRKCSGILGRY